jgi:hypothetical protein
MRRRAAAPLFGEMEVAFCLFKPKALPDDYFY